MSIATLINVDCRDCQYRFKVQGSTINENETSHTYAQIDYCPGCGKQNISVIEVIDIFKETHRNDRCRGD